MHYILKRLPPHASILSVYAVICFMVYSWTIIVTFWKLSSWLYILTLDEIIVINAYSFTTNLFESIFILGALLFLCMILPANFLKNDFTIRCTIIAVCFLGSAMLQLYLSRSYDTLEHFIEGMSLWWEMTLLVVATLFWMSMKIRGLRSAILEIADRMVVFLYLFVPLSFVSIFIVVIRNIN